jgi:hypothetical protein
LAKFGKIDASCLISLTNQGEFQALPSQTVHEFHKREPSPDSVLHRAERWILSFAGMTAVIIDTSISGNRLKPARPDA